jgi:hypothetical protein
MSVTGALDFMCHTQWFPHHHSREDVRYPQIYSIRIHGHWTTGSPADWGFDKGASTPHHRKFLCEHILLGPQPDSLEQPIQHKMDMVAAN